MLLALLFFVWLPGRDLVKGWALQPGSGGQHLQRVGRQPLGEIRATLGLDQKTAAASGCWDRCYRFHRQCRQPYGRISESDHKNLLFRETDAIGHPMNSLAGVVSGTGLLCQSQTTPFFHTSIRPRCLVLAPGGAGDLLSGQLDSLACARLAPGLCRPGECVSTYRLDHPGGRTQGCRDQCPAGR